MYVLVYNISTYVLLHWCFCFEEFFLTITYYYYYFATVDASWKKTNKQTNPPILEPLLRVLLLALKKQSKQRKNAPSFCCMLYVQGSMLLIIMKELKAESKKMTQLFFFRFLVITFFTFKAVKCGKCTICNYSFWFRDLHRNILQFF